ncbi:EscU/YscU/HrcU family type III secretion system export apparatus switch protein [Cupriavidus basilensis]
MEKGARGEEGRPCSRGTLSTPIMLMSGVAGLSMLAARSPASSTPSCTPELGSASSAVAFDTSLHDVALRHDGLGRPAGLPAPAAPLWREALAGPMLLGGWLFSAKSLRPRFSPGSRRSKGWSRLFSSQSLVELAKAIAEALLVGSSGRLGTVASGLPEAVALMSAPIHEALLHVLEMVLSACAMVAGSLVLVAAIDVPWRYWTFYKKLRYHRKRSSRSTRKAKATHISRRASARQQRAMAKRRMMSEVPKADVVVTQPRTSPWRCA